MEEKSLERRITKYKSGNVEYDMSDLTIENMFSKMKIIRGKVSENMDSIGIYVMGYNSLATCDKIDGYKFKTELIPTTDLTLPYTTVDYDIPKFYDFYGFIQIYNVPAKKIEKIEFLLDDVVHKTILGKDIGVGKIYLGDLPHIPNETLFNSINMIRVHFLYPAFKKFLKVDIGAYIVNPTLHDIFVLMLKKSEKIII